MEKQNNLVQKHMNTYNKPMTHIDRKKENKKGKRADKKVQLHKIKGDDYEN